MRYISLTILAACLLFIGCSATDKITMSVQEPAKVNLPPNVNKVGVINRALTEDESNVPETIDKFFSFKGSVLDSTGAAAGITNLLFELSGNDRVEAQLISDVDNLANPEYGVFPAPLQWDRINEICKKHNLDGLFSLEFYDTDSRINYTSRRLIYGGESATIEHHATVETIIEIGWRIYNNKRRNIIDEHVMVDTAITTGRGINRTEALKAVTGRMQAVQATGGELGTRYAQRIQPYWNRVTRKYYVKGNDNFEMAMQRAQAGNWDGAAEIWLMETESPDPKIAGRAHYNMAVVEELRGNLERAIAWARTAYEDYGDKYADQYLNTLQDRANRADILSEQQE